MDKPIAHRAQIRRMSISLGALCIITGLSVGLHAQQVSSVVITCLGDSVTEGVGSGGPQYTYPAQMEALLNNNFYDKTFEIHNRGHGGDRAEDTIVLLDTEQLPEDPDFVLLKIGGNDLGEAANDWGNIDAVVDQTVSEVQGCVDRIKAHTNADGSHPTLILSTFIPNRLLEDSFWGSWGTEGIRRYNTDLKNDLTGYDLLIESNWQDFIQSYGVWGRANPTYMTADEIHPNATGYGVMAQNWFDALCTFSSMKDSDSDGIYDADEATYGTNKNASDTDGDGISDLVEVTCSGATAATDPNVQSVIRINFQPLLSSNPSGYVQDSARAFSTAKGFGWLGL